MTEISTKMYSLIKQLMDSNGHLLDIITSRPPETYTEKERLTIVLDQVFLDKAVKDLKEVVGDE